MNPGRRPVIPPAVSPRRAWPGEQALRVWAVQDEEARVANPAPDLAARPGQAPAVVMRVRVQAVAAARVRVRAAVAEPAARVAALDPAGPEWALGEKEPEPADQGRAREPVLARAPVLAPVLVPVQARVPVQVTVRAVVVAVEPARS
jgi:hypothetical protein